MNRTRSNNNANAVNSSASLSTSTSAMQYFDTRITPQSQALAGFTSTAKLPIETVKRLIAAVSRRPNLWIRQNCGKRYDITQLWQEVGEETQLPADVCRIKWGHLRDNFRKVFIRNTLSDETPTTWRFYNDMRFMEKSVAENIMRQNRYKEQTRYWPEIQQQQQQQQTHSAPATPPPHLLHPMVSICTLKPNVKMDPQSMQSFGIYTETDEMELPNKRIKTEPADNYLNGHADKINKNHNNNIHNNYNNNNHNYPQIDEAEHEPDDDDFDEDTATEENEHPPHHSTMHQQMSSTNNNNNNHNNHSKSKLNENDQMYSMEVFNVDDDDDDENTASSCQQNGNKPILLKGRTLFNGKTEAFSSSSLDEQTQQSYLPNTHIKKTESIANEDQDADRMFLLSLLPYLRNIEGNRKLFVRQKLQNVLIEELS